MFCRTCSNMIVMSRHTPNSVIYAPLYIHSFRLIQPHMLVDAEKFNNRYTDPEQIKTIADKLRWYRHKNGLLQKEVADYAGLDRSTYSNYESNERDYYSIEIMRKFAELYSVPVTALLDDYNLFLYHGQGKQIREMRQRRGMTQAEFARSMDVPLGTLKQWEQERVQIFKSTWEKLMSKG